MTDRHREGRWTGQTHGADRQTDGQDRWIEYIKFTIYKPGDLPCSIGVFRQANLFKMIRIVQWNMTEDLQIVTIKYYKQKALPFSPHPYTAAHAV